MGWEQRKTLIEQIEKQRNSRLICCLTSDRQNANGVLAKDFIPVFYEHLRQFPKTNQRIDIFMFTLGGDTLAAFGLSRLIREFASEVGALIPEKCHSGGTLFSLGADQICMTRVATLSPIDPSIAGPLNPFIEIIPGQRQPLPISVESVAGYKELVKKDWELSEQNVGTAFRILAEKINPLALGDVYRSRHQIARLAKSLMHNHRRDNKKIDRIVDELTRQLGSHDYLISRQEARSILGKQVITDDEKLEDAIWLLYKDFAEDMQLGMPYVPAMIMNAAKAANQATPIPVQMKVVVIESAWGTDTWERQDRLSLGQVMTPTGPVENIRQDIVSSGWKHSARPAAIN